MLAGNAFFEPVRRWFGKQSHKPASRKYAGIFGSRYFFQRVKASEEGINAFV